MPNPKRLPFHVRCAAVLLMSGSALWADDPQPTPVETPALPKASEVAPPATVVVPPATVVEQPAATPVIPEPNFVPDVATHVVPQEPVPVVAGNGWAGGWSGAYAPSGSYWYGVPAYTYAPYYVPGYTTGVGPTTWNGYWNYSTAYGAPGYTAYWHGWYAGPQYNYGYGYGYDYAAGYGYAGGYGGYGYDGGQWNCGWNPGPYHDYAWPTWGQHGWGYDTLGWGHGYWHRHRVFSPPLLLELSLVGPTESISASAHLEKFIRSDRSPWGHPHGLSCCYDAAEFSASMYPKRPRSGPSTSSAMARTSGE
jgi:hypothetical protein